MTYEEKIIWHEISIRPPTEEEIKEYKEERGYEICYMIDGVLPDDGQEILVATKWGVDKDICAIDDYGYGLEGFGDWDDVLAWAEMPKYKAGETE